MGWNCHINWCRISEPSTVGRQLSKSIKKSTTLDVSSGWRLEMRTPKKCNPSYLLPSLKLTNRPWKSIVGKLMFILRNIIFRGELLVSGRVIILFFCFSFGLVFLQIKTLWKTSSGPITIQQKLVTRTHVGVASQAHCVAVLQQGMRVHSLLTTTATKWHSLSSINKIVSPPPKNIFPHISLLEKSPYQVIQFKVTFCMSDPCRSAFERVTWTHHPKKVTIAELPGIGIGYLYRDPQTSTPFIPPKSPKCRQTY